MSALRTLAVVSLVLVLGALAVLGGLDQLDHARGRRRHELTELARRDVQRTARVATLLIEDGHDAGDPALVELLAGCRPLPGSRATLVPRLPELVDRRNPPGALVLAQTVRRAPPLTLKLEVPGAALERATDPAATEQVWVLGTMGAVLGVLVLVGAVVLRLSQRTFRLRETERYLRWIRRVTDRYRALMEGAADLILILEPGSDLIREANAAARQALGLSRHAEALSPRAGPGAERLGPRLRADSGPRFEAALARATAGQPTAERGLQLETADGRPLLADAHLALVDVGDERVIQLSLRDVTAQRQLERQLQTHERLASLGLLTAGVAHEVNNPLEGVGNYLSLLERPGLDDERRARYVGQIRHGFERIRDIVQDLLSFARSDAPAGRADLRRALEGALGLARLHTDVRGIALEREGLDEPLWVIGDERQLEQVLLNLLLNASQAMQGRGTLRLRGGRETRANDARFVRLEVADDGPGIPAEDLDRLFDPFFSGRGGTGLGLSVSFGIVAAHGGELRATNAPAGGAVFTLELPASPEDPP